MCWVWQWHYLFLIPYIHRDTNTAISARAHHHEKVIFCLSSAEKYINDKINGRFSPFQEHHIFPTCIDNACASYRLEYHSVLPARRHRRTSMPSGGFFLDGRWELCRNHTNSYIHFDISSSQNIRLTMRFSWAQCSWAAAGVSTAFNVQMHSYSHGESASEVVRLDSPSDAPESYRRAQHKMPTQMHHSTSIRINTMANSVAPHRRENATGWTILIICTNGCAV